MSDEPRLAYNRARLSSARSMSDRQPDELATNILKNFVTKKGISLRERTEYFIFTSSA